MKRVQIAGLVAGLLMAALPGMSQTAAEQMRKGIYTQETEGNLDGAISIYRQIVNSGSSPRDVAAQAQYRLAQCLLQKGDLGNAAQEFEKLARSYADYSQLVSSLASQAKTEQSGGNASARAQLDLEKERLFQARAQTELTQLQSNLEQLQKNGSQIPFAEAQRMDAAKKQLAAIERALVDAEIRSEVQRSGSGQALEEMSFDTASPITVTGQINTVRVVLPGGYVRIKVKGNDGQTYTFLTSMPFETQKQGLTMANTHGSEVTIVGILAKGGAKMPDGSVAASATTVTMADGRRIFDRNAVAH